MELQDFQKIFCINLARRADRWAECEAEFKKFDLKVERFEAIEPPERNHSITKPQLGCLLSHLEILKRARAEGLKNVLVLEDDVAFDRDVKSNFKLFFAEVPEDWQMLYLGGNHYEFGARPMQMISPHVGRVKKTLTTHAYAVRETAYDQMIEYISPAEIPLDMYFTELQPEFSCYGFLPNLASQRTSYSDITETVVNYSVIIPIKRD